MERTVPVASWGGDRGQTAKHLGRRETGWRVLAGTSKGKKVGFVQCPGGHGEVGSKRGGFLLR